MSTTVSETDAPSPIPVPPGFPVHWDNDEEPTLLWRWDDFHSPLPRTPMTRSVGDYTREGMSQAARETGRYTPGGLRKVINGYPYSASRPYEPSSEEQAAREERLEQAIEDARERWDKEWQPRLARDLAEMKSMPFDALCDSELRSTVGRCLQLHGEHWRLHHLVVMPAVASAERLEKRYVEVMGEQAAPVTHRLLYGRETLTAKAIQALDQLVDAAEQCQSVRDALVENTGAPQVFGDLQTTTAGCEWLAQFNDYLEEYGYRCAGFDLRFPTWREDPSFVFQNIRARLLSERRESWAQNNGRLLAERDAMLAEIRRALRPDPDALAEFEQLYARAQSLWPLKEDHSHYIDQASTAVVRIMLAEVGRRLAKRGAIRDPDDIWFLTLDEALSDLEAPAPADRSAEVQSRRDDLEEWSKLTPPRHLGSYPAGYDGEVVDQNPAFSEVSELRGTAASAGEATGPARVVMSPDDFDKIRAGDILVCRSTAPMWTPLFEVIAGLVSESGGILSHPAVVAREFGLPAVVGVRDATGLLRDGELVAVSGGSGLVRRLD